MKENWRVIVAIVFVFFVAIAATAFVSGLGSTFYTAGTAATATSAATAGSLTAAGTAAVGAITGAASGAFNAAINGGDFGDILRGAVVGGIQGAITGGILHGWEEAATTAQGINKASAITKHVVGHGVVGGAANVAMGNKFQDGFLSGAASAAAVHAGLTSITKGSRGEAIGMAGRTAASAVIGGTASVLGGGKFANGAYTAAFQHLLNAESAGLNILKGTAKAVKGTIKFIARSPLGYAWSSPNTAIGIGWGLAGLFSQIVILPFTRKWGLKINFDNNALQFINHPLTILGAITIGNTIHYGSQIPPEENHNAYGRTTNVGLHEQGHTYQQQLFGPLFIPSYILTGGPTSTNPFEIGADNFASGHDWLPTKKYF